MQSHLRAFHHRTILALISPSQGPQHRVGAGVIFIWCVSCALGCATVDFVEAPRPAATLEDVLASEDTVDQCLEPNVRPPSADDTQTSIWQDVVRDHLKECGAKLTSHYLKALVALPTFPGNLEARDQSKALLLRFATNQNLTFTTIGTDELWILELGEGPSLADFVTLLEVQPGPMVMPIDRRRTAPALALTADLDRIYGRGVEDNKTAIAALMTLLQSLSAHREELIGRIRLIVLPNAKSDLTSISEWTEEEPNGPNTFLLNSSFPATHEVLGSQDLSLNFRSDEGNKRSASPWQLEALGGGHSSISTPQEALLVLQYRGSEITNFLDEVDYLGQLAEQKLEHFGDDLSIDIRPLHDELRAVVVARGASSSYASPIRGINPLFFVGHLGYDLDILPSHGTAALEFLMHLAPGLRPRDSDSTSFLEGSLTKDISPVMLRFSKEGTRLRLRGALAPNETQAVVLTKAEALLKSIQTQIWSLTDWNHPPKFESGYKLEATAPRLQLAQQVFKHYFPDSSTALITEREGTLARLFPGSIGFGPLLPGRSPTSTSFSESLPTSVMNRWARMLFAIVEGLSDEKR